MKRSMTEIEGNFETLRNCQTKVMQAMRYRPNWIGRRTRDSHAGGHVVQYFPRRKYPSSHSEQYASVYPSRQVLFSPPLHAMFGMHPEIKSVSTLSR